MLRKSLKIHSWLPYYELPVSLTAQDIQQSKRGSIARWNEPLEWIATAFNYKENKDLSAVA